MTFTIIKVGKNPRKKMAAPKRFWRIKQGTSTAKVAAKDYEGAKERAAEIGLKKPDSIVLIDDLKSNPKKRKRIVKKNRAKKARKRIIRVKKNPPTRKRLEKIIVGYVRFATKKVKRYYFTGTGFVKDKSEAKIYPGDMANNEAKRIVHRLPDKVYQIAVERV